MDLPFLLQDIVVTVYQSKLTFTAETVEKAPPFILNSIFH